jgi:predicted RNA binding protein YcfA (HicA-like mRNA interferase family)
MKLPRDLDGSDLVNHLCTKWGYRKVHQVGSHVVLETDSPNHQRVSIPSHRPVRIGTLAAILRAVASHKGVSRGDLLKGL